MAIIRLLNDEPLPRQLPCAICGKQIAPDEAIAGLLDADSQQRFACNGHFWNPHQFIAGWADFMATERARRTRNQFALEYGEEQNARAVRCETITKRSRLRVVGFGAPYVCSFVVWQGCHCDRQAKGIVIGYSQAVDEDLPARAK